MAEQVSFNDPDIKAQYAKFDSPKGHKKGKGYLVTPSHLAAKAPSVSVVHESYDKDMAELAWKRTIEFFNKQLR